MMVKYSLDTHVFIHFEITFISKVCIRKICCKQEFFGDQRCFVDLKYTNFFKIRVSAQKLPVKTIFLFRRLTLFLRANRQFISFVWKGSTYSR